jgi:hypothetical protein
MKMKTEDDLIAEAFGNGDGDYLKDLADTVPDFMPDDGPDNEPITCRTLEELLEYFRQYGHLDIVPADDPETLRVGWLFCNADDEKEAYYVTMRLTTAKEVLGQFADYGGSLITKLREMAGCLRSPGGWQTPGQAGKTGFGQLKVDMEP